MEEVKRGILSWVQKIDMKFSTKYRKFKEHTAGGTRPFVVTYLICSRTFSCSSGYNANNPNAKPKVCAVTVV